MNSLTGANIELTYLLNSDEIEIPSSSISSMILDYNYDINNMPIIYLNLNISNIIYDKIISNTKKGYFKLVLQRISRNTNIPIPKDDINQLFTYMMPTTNMNYDKALTRSETSDNTYRRGAIVLMSLDNINDNNVLVNNIIKNTNNISIIHYYTNHMNMIIEPFTNNEKYSRLIIPPTSTITKLINFLDSEKHFYNNRYRYFRDLNRTYLLSSSGNAIDDGDNVYDTIILNITNPLEKESFSSGIEVDKKSKSYNIYISANATDMSINNNDDLEFDTIVGYDYKGDYFKYVFDDKKREYGERVLLKTINNEGSLISLKESIEDTSVILNVTKSEIDSSLLTPNKEYIIKNYEDMREYDGRYLLSYKKEIFINQNEDFISSTAFGLRKVRD